MPSAIERPCNDSEGFQHGPANLAGLHIYSTMPMTARPPLEVAVQSYSVLQSSIWDLSCSQANKWYYVYTGKLILASSAEDRAVL